VIHLHGESPNPELRYASTCTPPAIAVPHATSLRDFTDRESAMHDSLTSRTPILRTPKPRSPMPSVLHSAIGKSHSGNRGSWCTRSQTLPNPESRLLRILRHVPLSDQRPQLIREIAGRDFKELELALPGTPNAEPRYPGSDATCPSDDRRLPLIREIAGRDFKEFEPLSPGNTKPRTPILRDLTPRVPILIDGSDRFGESRLAISRGVELSPYQSPNAETPKSDGLWFSTPILTGYLPRNSSTIGRSSGFRETSLELPAVDSLPLENPPTSKLSFGSKTLPGLFLRCLQGTAPPELLSLSDSFRDFSRSSGAQPPTALKA
jgi:hypothetical protein